MCELLWSDPDDISEWESNPRGAGVIFGIGLVDKFLRNIISKSHRHFCMMNINIIIINCIT